MSFYTNYITTSFLPAYSLLPSIYPSYRITLILKWQNRIQSVLEIRYSQSEDHTNHQVNLNIKQFYSSSSSSSSSSAYSNPILHLTLFESSQENLQKHNMIHQHLRYATNTFQFKQTSCAISTAHQCLLQCRAASRSSSMLFKLRLPILPLSP